MIFFNEKSILNSENELQEIAAKSVRILDLLSASYAGNSAYFEAFDDYSIFPAAFLFN